MQSTTKKRPIAEPEGFDVTCTIGRVEFGGDKRPDVAAFELIATHDAEGVFSFPGFRVTVEHVDDNGNHYSERV